MTANEQQKIIKSARARGFKAMVSELENLGAMFQQAAQSMLAFSKAYHRTTNTNPVITRVSVEKRVH